MRAVPQRSVLRSASPGRPFSPQAELSSKTRWGYTTTTTAKNLRTIEMPCTLVINCFIHLIQIFPFPMAGADVDHPRHRGVLRTLLPEDVLCAAEEDGGGLGGGGGGPGGVRQVHLYPGECLMGS